MNVSIPTTTRPPLERRVSPLLAATGRQGHPSRPAALRRRGSPGPASARPAPHSTPVPTSAHDIPRAIRVRRSPR
jgi:hypothetical protein